MPIIDRIKFDSPSDDVLVWKYPSQELRLGSQLIVHPTQEAVFVKGEKQISTEYLIFPPYTENYIFSELSDLFCFYHASFSEVYQTEQRI